MLYKAVIDRFSIQLMVAKHLRVHQGRRKHNESSNLLKYEQKNCTLDNYKLQDCPFESIVLLPLIEADSFISNLISLTF